MNPQLTYFMVQQKQRELADRAERVRRAREARAAVSAQPRRSNLGRLIASWRLGAAGLSAAAQPASPGPPQVCVRGET